MEFARKYPSALLLFAQLGALLLYPFLEDSEAGRAGFSLLGILILGLAVLAVRSLPAVTWIALLVAAPALVLLVVQVATDSAHLIP